MKIDEIIKKSIEIPGISIKRGEFSAELILKERDGKGSMTFFPLFPGGQPQTFTIMAPWKQDHCS